MTLTLDPQTERTLTEAAQACGLAPETAIIHAVHDWAARHQANGSNSNHQSEPEASEQEKHRAAVYAAMGMFAGQLPSMDEFLADRRAVALAELDADEKRGRNAQR